MFFYGPLHMDLPKLAAHQENICINSMLENLLGVMDDREG